MQNNTRFDFQRIPAPLLLWYGTRKRDLPWRNNPTPYQVWVSEIMLQQTRVDAVKEHYLRWMHTLPTVADLAAASPDTVRKLWEGLGYYSRVRHLHQAAQIVMRDWGGELPNTYEGLRSLPGIGDYTAGAILSIAFGKPYPAVDGNVLRVLSRLTADDTDVLTPRAKSRAFSLLQSIMPAEHTSDFTQAMFEMGAIKCTPVSPKCESCPVRSHCLALQEGRVDELPRRQIKTKRKEQPLTVFVVALPQGYLLTAPRSKGLLADLYGLPYTEGHLTQEGAKEWAESQGIRVARVLSLAPAHHVFTHVTWQMIGYRIEGEHYQGKDVVVPVEELSKYALPSAFNAYKKELL